MHNVKSPPVNLDKYLEGDKKRYLTYEDAARRYSMPYWTFVNLAKEAGATWVLRKTAMVDIDKLEILAGDIAHYRPPPLLDEREIRGSYLASSSWQRTHPSR